MTKRLVDIDDDLLSVERTILETDTMRDTVNAALKQISDLEAMRRHTLRLMDGDGLDLHDPEVMKGAWR